MSSMEFRHSFFASMALTNASSNVFCWLATSYSNPRHFLWYAPNSSHSAPHSNDTSWNWICITSISLHSTSLKACSTMSAILWRWICSTMCQPTPPPPAPPHDLLSCQIHIRCHLNDKIELLYIHQVVHVQLWLKGTLFPMALNNSIIHHKRRTLDTKCIQCYWFGNKQHWWYQLKKKKGVKRVGLGGTQGRVLQTRELL